MTDKGGIAIKEGLFAVSSHPKEDPHLIGSRCHSCGEAFFPKRAFCGKCFEKDLDEVTLSNRGRLYSFTVVRQAPPGYIGRVPYFVGKVDLFGGVRVLTLLTDARETELEIGMEMELIIDRLGLDEEGNEVPTYMFRPCRKEGKSK